MKYRPLGRSGLDVSAICLGTMTWGSQNSEAEAHAQLDYALGRGVNFIDTAELYPTTPASAETWGDTERFIGTWLAGRGRRDDVIIGSKVAGGGREWIDEGAELSAAKIRTACERSLKRLQTDYIDLYQLHWPNRGSYHFRRTWTFSPDKEDTAKTRDDIAEALETLGELVKEGKVRHVGLSNETVWGTMRYLGLAEARGLPRIQSIQNEYSLLHRIFDTDFAELSHQEDVGLLAYSPLAAGMLSGKYRGGSIGQGTRMAMQPDLNGRYTDRSKPALEAYLEIAEKHGCHPAQMALAFCLSRPFMTSVIIGATSMEQLETNIGAADLDLDDAIQADIQAVFKRYPIPM